MQRDDCYTAADVAAKLRICVDTLYRNYARYVQDDGMPASISSRGAKRFDRASIDAWLGRNHPLAIKQTPANDSAPPRAATIDEERRELARAYGGR